MTRLCPHPDCATEIPQHLFACRPHWRALPKWIQEAINLAFRKYRAGSGTLIQLDAAQRRAIDWWQRPIPVGRTPRDRG